MTSNYTLSNNEHFIHSSLMRSKIFKKILDETPLETRIFVEKYSELILRISQILKERGLSKKQQAEFIEINLGGNGNSLSGNQNIKLKDIALLEAKLQESIIVFPLQINTTEFKYKWLALNVRFTVKKQKVLHAEETEWFDKKKIRFVQYFES